MDSPAVTFFTYATSKLSFPDQDTARSLVSFSGGTKAYKCLIAVFGILAMIGLTNDTKKLSVVENIAAAIDRP